VRIDPDGSAAVRRHGVSIWEEPDALAPLLSGAASGLAALGEEIRRVFLGYDAEVERTEKLVAFLEAPLPRDAGSELLDALAEAGRELVLFADVEQLFIRIPRASVSGEPGLRMRRVFASSCGACAPPAPVSPRSSWRCCGLRSRTTVSPTCSPATHSSVRCSVSSPPNAHPTRAGGSCWRCCGA
jgi:hypothetical protein